VGGYAPKRRLPVEPHLWVVMLRKTLPTIDLREGIGWLCSETMGKFATIPPHSMRLGGYAPK